MNAGACSREQIRGWICNRFYYQISIPLKDAAILSNCPSGWGSIFLTVAPDGTALPCHAARMLPGAAFPNVRDSSLEAIWYDSEAFNRYRGDGWMREPCRSCPEKGRDYGGCRCQAYMLTGEAANADPVCALSPDPALKGEVSRAWKPVVSGRV